MEGDFDDPSCSKNESDWQSSKGVFSILNSIILSDDKVVFIMGDNGYSGTFQFQEDKALTQPFLDVLDWNSNEKEFAAQVTIPTCSPFAICPTMKIDYF